MRLIDHLRGLGMSNRQAKQQLSSGKVFYRDCPVADPVRDVDENHVRVIPNAPRIRVGVDLAILFCDEHLAVVLKPSGMLSVPAASQRGATSVIAQTRRALGAAWTVHRLDQETSGLMLVARSESAQFKLKDLFFRHDIERRYRAIVAGRFALGRQRIETTFTRDRGDGRRGSRPFNRTNRGDDQEGKLAITHFEHLQHLGPSASLIEATLETGRTHQVRIHAAELGHPVLGDRLYGGKDGKKNARQSTRLALHARVLGFRHPFTGATHRFVAPLSDDLTRLVRQRSQYQGDRRRRTPKS